MPEQDQQRLSKKKINDRTGQDRTAHLEVLVEAEVTVGLGLLTC